MKNVAKQWNFFLFKDANVIARVSYLINIIGLPYSLENSQEYVWNMIIQMNSRQMVTTFVISCVLTRKSKYINIYSVKWRIYATVIMVSWVGRSGYRVVLCMSVTTSRWRCENVLSIRLHLWIVHIWFRSLSVFYNVYVFIK